MAISLKHNKTSSRTDGTDTSLVQPSDWNAEHVLTLATSRLLGRTTAGAGAAEEISVGSGLSLASGSISLNLTSALITTALGYTPANEAGDTFTSHITVTGDITAYRTATPTTGVIYFGNTGTRYLYFDGSSYIMPGGQLVVNGSSVLTAGNYNTYSPTLTGTGASGSWGISITGNAANVTGTVAIANGGTAATTAAAALSNLGAAALAGATFSGKITTANTNNTMAVNNTASVLEVRNASGTGDTSMAMMAFHCASTYGAKLGLRADGVIGLGGWSAAAWRWYVSLSTGDMVAAGNVTAYSDERKKTNWRDLSDDFVPRLAAVKTGVYDRIDEELTQVGVSAQSLREVLPQAVVTGEDGDYLTVAYGNAALASAVMLARKVVDLEARLKELEGK